MNPSSKFSAFLTVILAVAILSACVQTRPLKSHAHIGHALTSWHDTPGQEGLYAVAARELDFAIDAVNLALTSTTDAERARRHLDNALHALNSDLKKFGKGLDYGAIRAMVGAIEHLEYAANSEDASDNFVASVVSLADQGDLVVTRMVQAQQLITAMGGQNPATNPRLIEVRKLVMAAKFGDPDGGAITGSLARSDWGLVHISAQLTDMLARENDPEYEPVPRKYVLGLIRLPGGRWGYRLSRPSYGSAGYSY